MVSEDKINEAVRRIVEGFHPVRVILFGSQARGGAGPESDVDLLIVCDTLPPNRRDLAVEIRRALRGLRLPTDLVLLTQEEFEKTRDRPGAIAGPASKEGRVLYDKAA